MEPVSTYQAMEKVSGNRRMAQLHLFDCGTENLFRCEQFNSIQLDWDFPVLILVTNHGSKADETKTAGICRLFLYCAERVQEIAHPNLNPSHSQLWNHKAENITIVVRENRPQ